MINWELPLSWCQVPKSCFSGKALLSNSKFTCWHTRLQVSSSLYLGLSTEKRKYYLWETKTLRLYSSWVWSPIYNIQVRHESSNLQIHGFFFFNRKIAIRRRKNTVWTYLQLSKQKYPKKKCIEILSRIDFKVIKMSTYKKKKK